MTLAPVRGRVLDIDSGSVMIAPGQPRPLTVRLRDLSGGAGDVMLAVSGEGVTASPTSVLVQLDGSGEGSVEVTVDALADSPLPGQATLVLSAEGMERRLPVTLLLATRLGAVTASSTFAGHPAESAIDG